MMLESSPAEGRFEEPQRLLGRPRAGRAQRKRALARQLREQGVFSSAHAVDVALDVCGALAIAHANGIVHGQLGLHCVRLAFTHEGGPRDVEIFALGGDDGDSGVVVTAAPFLAPEQRELSAPIDGRADVWALGALLYSMLVGMAPPAVSASTPISVPEGSIAPTLAAVVESCLAIDPRDRPQTVDVLAEKLASFASSPPDRFARLAERRAAAEQRKRLELRGLADMPVVLDRLDDLAVTRALDASPTATISSVLHGASTEKAMERLMTAVHEGTDEARVELASGLPALIDFDDEDEEVLPTVVREESEPFELVASPLSNAPASMAALAAFAGTPVQVTPDDAKAPRLWSGKLIALLILTAALSAFAVVFGAQMLATTAEEPARATTPSPPPPPTAKQATPPATATAAAATATTAAPKSTIPTFTVSALPDAKR